MATQVVKPIKPSTRASYVAAYRKAITAYYEEHSPAEPLLATKETTQGTIIQHCALNYLFAALEDYAQGREQTKTKSAAHNETTSPASTLLWRSSVSVDA